MSATPPKLSVLRDAASAIVEPGDARPAWVWAENGGSMIWANEAGLEALGLSDLDSAEVQPSAPAVRSLQAVARSPVGASGRGRIEILRVNADGHHATLVATCRAIMLGETQAVLAMGNASQRRSSTVSVPLPNDTALAAVSDETPSQSELAGAGMAASDEDSVHDAVPVELVGTSVDPQVALAPSTGFSFKPRSRPHRFSFMVGPDGAISSLSSGLADAVGDATSMEDGEDAVEAITSRVAEVPAAVTNGLEARNRFKEHEVLWPVSGHDLAVPVRLSAFDEDDGALRVFGTVLTGKAVAMEPAAITSEVGDTLASEQDSVEADEESQPTATASFLGTTNVALAGAVGAAALSADADTDPDDVGEAEAEGEAGTSEPASETVADEVQALTDALSDEDALEAGLFAPANDPQEPSEPTVAMTSQIPGGAALAAAIGALTAGVSQGLARPLPASEAAETVAESEPEIPSDPVTALDDEIEPDEAQRAGLWAPESANEESASVIAAPIVALEDALETGEAQVAGLWAPATADDDDAGAEVEPANEAQEPDVATATEPDFPSETIDAMKAVATGIAAGLAGGVAGGVLAGGSDDEQAADVFDTSEPDAIIPTGLREVTTPSDADGEDDLSRPERLTFQEIARRLGARITGRSGEDEASEDEDGADALTSEQVRSGDVVHLTGPTTDAVQDDAEDQSAETVDEAEAPALETPSSLTQPPSGGQVLPFSRSEPNAERMVLDRLPLGVIIYTDDAILYANRAALDLAGLSSLQALKALGGIESLFAQGIEDGNGAMVMRGRDGALTQVTGRLQSVRWDDQSAALLSVREHTAADSAAQENAQDDSLLAEAASGLAGAALGAGLAASPDDRANSTDGALPLVRARIGELEAIIDLASDGVVTLDAEGEIKDLNQAAEALVGYGAEDLIGRPFRLLFPEDSRQIALDYFEDMVSQGRLSLFNEGRELECITAQGGMVPVFMTLGRLSDDEPAGYCAVLRDLSPFKQAENDLVDARRAAEEASAHKSDFLARVSHEIRTPLNAVIGFSEVMLEERFGPVGSERYRQYLRDIHTSGEHLMSLLNDLMDLSKIEAGKMDLTFGEVDLNDLVQQCLVITQPQASQSRIIVRTSLPLTLPHVVADMRSIRQVILNLMTNAIKFTDAGGQIIVSTLYEPSGEASLRVRDTGRGMEPADLELALQPFQQVPTTLNQVITGTGLGLPLTKALVEANRAQFALESTPGEGTLAIVTFPSQRVLAE